MTLAPHRFGMDRAWAARAARPLRLVAGRGAGPDDDALIAGLLRADPLAAELVRAVRPNELHRALAAGPDADVPEPVRAFYDAVSRRPDGVPDGIR